MSFYRTLKMRQTLIAVFLFAFTPGQCLAAVAQSPSLTPVNQTVASSINSAEFRINSSVAISYDEGDYDSVVRERLTLKSFMRDRRIPPYRPRRPWINPRRIAINKIRSVFNPDSIELIGGSIGFGPSVQFIFQLPKGDPITVTVDRRTGIASLPEHIEEAVTETRSLIAAKTGGFSYRSVRINGIANLVKMIPAYNDSDSEMKWRPNYPLTRDYRIYASVSHFDLVLDVRQHSGPFPLYTDSLQSAQEKTGRFDTVDMMASSYQTITLVSFFAPIGSIDGKKTDLVSSARSQIAGLFNYSKFGTDFSISTWELANGTLNLVFSPKVYGCVILPGPVSIRVSIDTRTGVVTIDPEIVDMVNKARNEAAQKMGAPDVVITNLTYDWSTHILNKPENGISEQPISLPYGNGYRLTAETDIFRLDYRYMGDTLTLIGLTHKGNGFNLFSKAANAVSELDPTARFRDYGVDWIVVNSSAYQEVWFEYMDSKGNNIRAVVNPETGDVRLIVIPEFDFAKIAEDKIISTLNPTGLTLVSQSLDPAGTSVLFTFELPSGDYISVKVDTITTLASLPGDLEQAALQTRNTLAARLNAELADVHLDRIEMLPMPLIYPNPPTAYSVLAKVGEYQMALKVTANNGRILHTNNAQLLGTQDESIRIPEDADFVERFRIYKGRFYSVELVSFVALTTDGEVDLVNSARTQIRDLFNSNYGAGFTVNSFSLEDGSLRMTFNQNTNYFWSCIYPAPVGISVVANTVTGTISIDQAISSAVLRARQEAKLKLVDGLRDDLEDDLSEVGVINLSYGPLLERYETTVSTEAGFPYYVSSHLYLTVDTPSFTVQYALQTIFPIGEQPDDSLHLISLVSKESGIDLYARAEERIRKSFREGNLTDYRVDADNSRVEFNYSLKNGRKIMVWVDIKTGEARFGLIICRIENRPDLDELDSMPVLENAALDNAVDFISNRHEVLEQQREIRRGTAPIKQGNKSSFKPVS